MTGQDIFIKRTFNAPRRRVWLAWTEPEQMVRWWGPKGFTVPSCRMNVQVGGDYLFCMRSPDNQDTWGTGIYREVVEMEKIVMTDSFADEKGNVVPASYYGMGGAGRRKCLCRSRLKNWNIARPCSLCDIPACPQAK